MIGEILETGGDTAKKAGKSLAGQISQTAKAAVGQTAPGLVNPQDGPNAQGQDLKTKDFVKDLYGVKKQNDPANKQSAGNDQNSNKAQKELEEKQKLAALRNKLHREYYQQISEPAQGEEPTVAQRLEREDQEKKAEDVEKKKNELPQLVVPGTNRPDIALSRAKTKTEIKQGGAG